MKIIDLLNKIANGEEILKFNYYGGTYIYDKETQQYRFGDMWFDLDFCNLNDEVEIIEEDKKIERIIWRSNVENLKQVDTNTNEVIDKINEIIDVINKGDK